MHAIPFNRISRVGPEFAYIRQAYEAMQTCGDGVFTKKCCRLLETALGVSKALLTTSCTDALEMAALLLEIKGGDEIILPSFTFPSVANAFVLRGATPVFIDIRPDTLNLNEDLLESLITPNTRAIVVVHYAGAGCEMNKILAIAHKYRIPVVEDNAHGLFGRYRGRFLGTWGCLATQSFHETKNFSCGEGGALLINDPQYIQRAEILREKGTNRSQFFRGQVDKYTWIDIGSSYLLSDILAAILYAQLEVRDSIQEKRRTLWERYEERLVDWAKDHGVRLPFVPADCEHTHHIFYLLLPDLGTRSALMEHLKERSIYSAFHYLPLHLSPMGRKFGGYLGQCPVTEQVSAQLLRLPLFASLTEADQDRVIRNIDDFSWRKRSQHLRPARSGLGRLTNDSSAWSFGGR